MFVSNNLHRFVNGSLNYGEDNFRIWSLDVGAWVALPLVVCPCLTNRPAMAGLGATSYMDAVANPECGLPSVPRPPSPSSGTSSRGLLLGLVLGGIGSIAVGSAVLALRARARLQTRVASEYHAML